MSSESSNPKLLSLYKRVLQDFQLIWAVKEHYEWLSYRLHDEELMTAPMDLNRIYGTLKVLYDVIQKADNAFVFARLDSAAKDLVATYQRFDDIDIRTSPYEMRFYVEKAEDLSELELKTWAKYFLNKATPSPEDLAKIDYLLARAFSWVNEDGDVRIMVESEEKLEEDIARLLPRKWRTTPPPNYISAAAKIIDYIAQVQAIKSYDDLMSSTVTAQARQFKSELGENFFNAQVLSKCVQLNVELRNRFDKFCREENERLKSFSAALLKSDAELVQDSIDSRQHVTLSSALEFSEKAPELLAKDYNQTLPYMTKLSQMRDMLQRTATLYGLEPNSEVASTASSLASALNDRSREEIGYFDSEALQARLNSLYEIVREIPSGAKPGAVKVLNLENTRLVLSSWEFDAFKPSPMDNYFARLNYDILKRSVALIAEIQENIALYRANESSPQLANAYLMKLNFYVLQAQKIAEELETQGQLATDRNEIDAACNLSATRQKLMDSYHKLKSLVQ